MRRFRPILLLLCLTAFRPALADSVAPPLPPPTKSPAEQFRELLAATPAERRALLTGKSVAAQNLILAKLREFEVLPADQRELRLAVAQLQFYLSPLLHADPGSRSNLLARTPAEDRPLLEDRLKAWDALPAETRRDILESERSLSYFVRQETADPKQLAALLEQVSPAARPELEAQFARWRALPADERARKTANFQRFFSLSDAERARTLGRLPEAERRQMDRTLSRLASLPPEQRDGCVRAFRRLAAMSPEERAEFLANASKWQAMSGEERAAWRQLVQRAANPPLPPPPIPVPLRRPAAALVATNAPAGDRVRD
jgi:Protein of unknown function (DUF3106)